MIRSLPALPPALRSGRKFSAQWEDLGTFCGAGPTDHELSHRERGDGLALEQQRRQNANLCLKKTDVQSPRCLKGTTHNNSGE